MTKPKQRGALGLCGRALWTLLIVLVITAPAPYMANSDSSSEDEEEVSRRIHRPSRTVLPGVVVGEGSGEEMDAGDFVHRPPSPENRTRGTSASPDLTPLTPPSSPAPCGSNTASAHPGALRAGPLGLPVINDQALLLLAQQRQRPRDRLDYYITPQYHPLGPYFVYPAPLPLFGGRGGNTLIGSVCAGMSSLLSVAECICLDTSQSPKILLQNLITKAPSKSFANEFYLLEMLRYCIARLIELDILPGIPTLSLRTLAQELYGGDVKICLLLAGESRLSVGISVQDLTLQSRLTGQNAWGLNCEMGLFRGLMGDLPVRPPIRDNIATVVLGDGVLDQFRPLLDSSVAILSRRTASLAEGVVWVLDRMIPGSAVNVVILLGNRDVRAGMLPDTFFRLMFDLLLALQRTRGSVGVIVNTLVPNQQSKLNMALIDRINGDLEHFRDLGWCELCRYGVQLRQKPQASWRLAFPDNNAPCFSAARDWWVSMRELFVDDGSPV